MEDCDRICSTPQKRRMHMIDKHMFPKDFDFYIVNDGIDRRSSMLRSGRHRRKSSVAQQIAANEEKARRRKNTLKEPGGQGQDVNSQDKEFHGESLEGEPDGYSGISNSYSDIDSLTGAMSSLNFIPPCVKFGHSRGRGRGGFSKR